MQALGLRNPNVGVGLASGKRPVEAPETMPGSKRVKVMDYTRVDGRKNASPLYVELAGAQLDTDFPMFYKQDVRNEFHRNKCFYAPTFKKLYDASVRNIIAPGLRRVRNKRTVRRKANIGPDLEFDREFEWVHSVWKVGYDAKRADRKMRRSGVMLPRPDAQLLREPLNVESIPAAEQSMKIECGCCYNDECSFNTMIQCPDAHLFCGDCVRAQAGVAVGGRQRDILCMDTSGCRQPFPVTELRKCLDARTFELWQRIVQADDIAAANLEGLEHCPACDFAMIFEVGIDAAPVLTCLQSDCRLVSCRRCKKKAHTGRACEDIEEAKLKTEHIVEEAMSKSIIRECPGCKLPFIKAEGCNKIVCQNIRCHKISCYLCRQIITLQNPYSHFDRQDLPPEQRCVLWDGVGGEGTQRRHEAEAAAAAQLERQRH